MIQHTAILRIHDYDSASNVINSCLDDCFGCVCNYRYQNSPDFPHEENGTAFQQRPTQVQSVMELDIFAS